jgi:hypothetical protein
MKPTNKIKIFSLELEEIELITIELFKKYKINTESDEEIKKIVSLAGENLKKFHSIDIFSFPKKEIEFFIDYVKDFLKNRLIQPPKQIIGLKNDDNIDLEEIFIKFNRDGK